MCHRQKQSIVFFPSPHIPIRLHQSIDSLMSDWIPSEIGVESWRGGEKREAQFCPMIKADPNCFDNIKDFVTGSRRAVCGADRSWRLRVVGTRMTRHLAAQKLFTNFSDMLVERCIVIIGNKSFFQKYNVEFDHFPIGEESCWCSITRAYPLSSYKSVVLNWLCCRFYIEHQVANQHSAAFVCYIK